MPLYKVVIKSVERKGSVGRELEYIVSSQVAGFSKKINRGAKDIRLVGEKLIERRLSIDLAASVVEKDKYPDSGSNSISVDLSPDDSKVEPKLDVLVKEYLGPKSKTKSRREAIFTFNFELSVKESSQEKRRKRAKVYETDLDKALKVLLPVVDGECKLDYVATRQLLLGTANHESDGFRCLEQQGSGPAKGVLQMEPKTYQDLWKRYLHKESQASFAKALRELAGATEGMPDAGLLKSNNAFASGMALARYLDHGAGRKFPLPAANDTGAQAKYWGKLYQTKSDPDKIAKYIKDWENTFGR